MEASLDFYEALTKLIDQIPDDMISTPLHIAEALGDRRAVRAVSTAIQREEFQGAKQKVLLAQGRKFKVFREFKSDLPLKRLMEFQEAMSKRIVREDNLNYMDMKLIGGVDVTYRDNEAYAVCVVVDRRHHIVESASARVDVSFPYIPRYLSFREAPAVEATAKLISSFDVLMVNGHGVAHPRGCGLASHVGLDLEASTIGVARNRLVGAVSEEFEGLAPLLYNGEVVGVKLSRVDYSPIFVSVGHNISLETSVEVVRSMMERTRLPEPLRLAHRASNEFKRLSVSSTSSP
jgi:deoxyribonuclease V